MNQEEILKQIEANKKKIDKGLAELKKIRKRIEADTKKSTERYNEFMKRYGDIDK